jgi:hypothetical protein
VSILAGDPAPVALRKLFRSTGACLGAASLPLTMHSQ